MHFSKKDFVSIPNILTYIRILLVPVFIIVYLNAETLAGHVWSFIIVLLSGATDVVDGAIARKYNLVTDWGKIIDPIADKAMQFAMLFCVVIRYHIVLILIIIYAFKEIISLAFSSFLYVKGKHINGAIWAGKVCTVILYVVMAAFIIIPSIPPLAGSIMIGFSSAFMLLAFVVYMISYLKLYNEYRLETYGKELKHMPSSLKGQDPDRDPTMLTKESASKFEKKQ